MSHRLVAAFRSRLSRRIAFWIFLNFMAVEAIVLIPSVLRQADRLADQMRQVTDAKIQWIVEESPGASPDELLAAVRRLQSPGMVAPITGAALLQASTGRRLGRFGAPPLLPLEEARRRAGKGRWFPLQGAYEGVWGRDALGKDLLLVVRHDAAGIRRDLASYVVNIGLIVLGIAAVLTVTTLLVMRRLVIDRVLTLRQKLNEAGRAFQEGS